MTNSRIPAAHAHSEQVQLLPRPTGRSFALPPDLPVSPRGPERPVILRPEHVALIGQLSLGGCDVPERMEFSRRSSSPRPPSAGALRAQRYACVANFSNGVGRHRGPRTSFQARKENKHAALVRTHTSLRPPFLFFFLKSLLPSPRFLVFFLSACLRAVLWSFFSLHMV